MVNFDIVYPLWLSNANYVVRNQWLAAHTSITGVSPADSGNVGHRTRNAQSASTSIG